MYIEHIIFYREHILFYSKHISSIDNTFHKGLMQECGVQDYVLGPWKHAWDSEVSLNKKGQIRAHHDDPHGHLMPHNRFQTAEYPDGCVIYYMYISLNLHTHTHTHTHTHILWCVGKMPWYLLACLASPVRLGSVALCASVVLEGGLVELVERKGGAGGA
jgi:hypothetical protein